MKRRLTMMAVTAAVLALLATASEAGELNVTISGFASAEGRARIVLVEGEGGYRGLSDPVAIASAEISGGIARWTKTGLPDGDYALIVHHDADGNDELNRPLFGIPTEPYGYSNAAWTSFGLPDWEAVRFEMTDGQIEQVTRLRTNAFVTAFQVLAAGIPSLVAIFLALALVRRLRVKSATNRQISEN